MLRIDPGYTRAMASYVLLQACSGGASRRRRGSVVPAPGVQALVISARPVQRKKIALPIGTNGTDWMVANWLFDAVFMYVAQTQFEDRATIEILASSINPP